jgi:hypothetical protein
MRRSGARGYPGRPRRPLSVLLPARLAAVSAAGLVALGGVAAAAYAQALPAPVQQIAHSVLAPLGVPASKPASGTGNALSSGTAHPSPTYPVSVATSAGAGGQAGQASQTASALATGHYAITLTAARARVPSGVLDLFAGKVSYRGSAASGIHVRLLERVAGSSGWQLVAAGVTGSRGRVRLWGPSMTTSATFRLAGPGGARSAPVLVTVTVTVTPPVRLRLVSGQAKDRLIVAAPGATSGETVDLMKLVSGAWQTVASKPLGPKLRAVFALPVGTAAGYFYRVSLPGSTTPASAMSNRVWVPRRGGTGANLVPSAGSQSPTPEPATTALATPSPTATPSSTSAPQPTSSSGATPTPEPPSSSGATPTPEPP